MRLYQRIFEIKHLRSQPIALGDRTTAIQYLAILCEQGTDIALEPSGTGYPAQNWCGPNCRERQLSFDL